MKSSDLPITIGSIAFLFQVQLVQSCVSVCDCIDNEDFRIDVLIGMFFCVCVFS